MEPQCTCLQIKSGLYAWQGEAVTKFDRTLPKPQSDLAQQPRSHIYSRRNLMRNPHQLRWWGFWLGGVTPF